MASHFAYSALSVSAVAAKAPRKNVASGRSSVISPGGTAGKRKAKGGGGNPLKLWPVPKGQKGLQGFLGGGGSDGASCSAGSSSFMEEGNSSEHFEEEEIVGASSSEQLEEGVSNTETGSSSSLEDSPPTTSNSISTNLLDDITQLNSDSDED